MLGMRPGLLQRANLYQAAEAIRCCATEWYNITSMSITHSLFTASYTHTLFTARSEAGACSGDLSEPRSTATLPSACLFARLVSACARSLYAALTALFSAASWLTRSRSASTTIASRRLPGFNACSFVGVAPFALASWALRT